MTGVHPYDTFSSLSEFFQIFETRWTISVPAIFRGEPREYPHSLCPSLFRNRFPEDENGIYDQYFRDYIAPEAKCKRDYMFDMLHPKPHSRSLPVIALAQHLAKPTRLLDVTLNPLVAIYFATASPDNCDGFIFFYLTGENYIDLNLETKERDLTALVRSEKIGPYQPADTTLLFYRPEWPNTRSAAQSGAFVFSKGFHQNLKAGGGVLRVPGEKKSEIRRQLERFGINSKSLHLDLDTE